MSPEEQSNTNESIATPKTSGQKVLKVILLLLMLASVGATGWYIMDKRSATPISQTGGSISYFSNDNTVACSVAPTKLNCENLETQELKEVTIPKKYQNSAGIIPSPDGSKLLITLSNGDQVVTDVNFNELIKIDDAEKIGDDRYPAYSWSGDSNSVIISEVRREQSDSDESPEPIVVAMFDIETGVRERVYKTGENVDVESVRVLGSNDTQLLISYATPKNWVADETAPPTNTINAVQLDNGSIKVISPQQVSGDAVHYDANKNTLLFEGAFSSDVGGDYATYPVTAVSLEDSEFGLVLQKLSELTDISIDTGAGMMTLTSKGALLAMTSETPAPFMLIEDDGTINELKLVRENEFTQLLSLKALPNIQAN